MLEEWEELLCGERLESANQCPRNPRPVFLAERLDYRRPLIVGHTFRAEALKIAERKLRANLRASACLVGGAFDRRDDWRSRKKSGDDGGQQLHQWSSA